MNVGVMIPGQLRWRSNPQTIWEREHRGEIKASSVVFVGWGEKIAHTLPQKGVTPAGVQYKVKPYTTAGPDSHCDLHWELGHRESKSNDNEPKCSYCAGLHLSNVHRCIIVRCASRQGASCSHTPQK